MKKFYICLCILQTILLFSILNKKTPAQVDNKQGSDKHQKFIPSLYKSDTSKIITSI